MEHQKILNFLNEAKDSKFVTRKLNIFNDQPNANYDVGNEIFYSTELLKSNLCDDNGTIYNGKRKYHCQSSSFNSNIIY